MAEKTYGLGWLVALAVVGLLVGGFVGASAFPEVVTETETVTVYEDVEVQIPGPEVEVPADYVLLGEEEWYSVDIEALQDDLASKLDISDLYSLAQTHFEDELNDYDECNGEDYRESELEIKDYDDPELVAYDIDDELEYDVSFEVEIEYDGDDVCVWDVTVSYDDEGDVEVEADLVE